MAFFTKLLDLIFPGVCLGCGHSVSHAVPVCAECEDGLKLEPMVGFDLLYINRVNTSCRYQNLVRKVLKEAKFRRRKEYLSFLMENFSSSIGIHDDVDLIIPIPLAEEKLLARGFNQSTIIADWLSKKSGVIVQDNVISRIKETKPLYGLSKHDRIDELEKAFILSEPSSVAGKSVLLVDDIVTTGATLISCAKLLREAGASSVTAFALARS